MILRWRRTCMPEIKKKIPTITDACDYIPFIFPDGLPADSFVLLCGSLGRGVSHPGSDIDMIIISKSFYGHNYMRKMWRNYPVDLNLTNFQTAIDMLNDPDWESMISESIIIAGNKIKGEKVVLRSKRKLEEVSRQKERAKIYFSEATELLSLCRNYEKPILQTCMFQSMFLGASAVCEMARFARVGHFWHMKTVEDAANKIKLPQLFTEYQNYNDGNNETFMSVWHSIKEIVVFTESLIKKPPMEVDPLLVAAIDERKIDSVRTAAFFLKKNKKLIPAVYVSRRYLLSLIQTVSRSILRLNYDRSRMSILLIRQIWPYLPFELQLLIEKSFPKAKFEEISRWLSVIGNHL